MGEFRSPAPGTRISERPATPRQRDYLESLLREAGFASYTDARRPLGLTQKQTKGHFTADEASTLIDALLEQQRNPSAAAPGASVESAERMRDARERAAEVQRANDEARLLQGIRADRLADELRRRGWIVSEPA